MSSQNTEVTNFSTLLSRGGESLAESMADAIDLFNRMRIVSILATSLCLPVVLLVLVAYINRSSRKHLDRVSFRLVVLALLCNLASSITLMFFYVRHNADCLGFMWSLQFFGQLCSNVSFCVGLNLLLVMVWRQDGRKLEKWYFIGSILQALIVSLPAAVAKAWGPDPITGSCGYVSLDPEERRRWRIATVLAWPLIDIIGELITFTWVLIFMMRSKAFSRTLINSRSRKSWISNTASQCTSGARRARKHQMVVLRILLYPLSAALSVILLVCGEIYTYRANPSVKVSKTLIPIGFLVRPVLYCLIMILDPSLLRALQTLFNILRGCPTESNLRSSSAPHGTESSGNNSHAISIATVTVSVSRSYPNEFELEEARIAAGQEDEDKGMKGDSNDVIVPLPRTPSPTKASAKFPNSNDAERNRDVTLDLPPRMGDVELGTTREPPGRLGRWGSLADRRTRDSNARVSEESAEFLKQL